MILLEAKILLLGANRKETITKEVEATILSAKLIMTENLKKTLTKEVEEMMPRPIVEAKLSKAVKPVCFMR